MVRNLLDWSNSKGVDAELLSFIVFTLAFKAPRNRHGFLHVLEPEITTSPSDLSNHPTKSLLGQSQHFFLRGIFHHTVFIATRRQKPSGEGIVAFGTSWTDLETAPLWRSCRQGRGAMQASRLPESSRV
ncbi:MAG TPA: hypothetical protein VNL74_06365 [Methylococcus sp.]|nr:hypothetical protein [Methylococcus sp.]